MNDNENEPVLPEAIMTPEQEEAHWNLVLRLDLENATQGELELMHHLPPLAQEMHDALADIIYEGDMAENILNLRRVLQWVENWDRTHVFTCMDGCKR